MLIKWTDWIRWEGGKVDSPMSLWQLHGHQEPGSLTHLPFKMQDAQFILNCRTQWPILKYQHVPDTAWDIFILKQLFVACLKFQLNWFVGILGSVYLLSFLGVRQSLFVCFSVFCNPATYPPFFPLCHASLWFWLRDDFIVTARLLELQPSHLQLWKAEGHRQEGQKNACHPPWKKFLNLNMGWFFDNSKASLFILLGVVGGI